MFAWLRKWWTGGEIPPTPDDCLLDFPDEEQWVFDLELWKWVAKNKPPEDGVTWASDIPFAILDEEE